MASEKLYRNTLTSLDTVYQGQYLPSLSINYVAINKDLEKLSQTVSSHLNTQKQQWPVISRQFILTLFSVYTLSDLGDSTNLIGSLSRTMTALGGEYKAKQNCCHGLGLLPSFRVRTL